MLEELVATRFAKPMTSGRTGPILLAGETPDGEEIEVIAKFSKGGDIGALGLGREALCAMLAADLGRGFGSNGTENRVKDRGQRGF